MLVTHAAPHHAGVVVTPESVGFTHRLGTHERVLVAGVLAVRLIVTLPLGVDALLVSTGAPELAWLTSSAGTVGLITPITAVPLPVTLPLLVDAVGREVALEHVLSTIDIAELLISAVLTVSSAITPLVFMNTLPIETRSFLF